MKPSRDSPLQAIGAILK